MSIVTVFHSKDRAVIAADGRSTFQTAAGERQRAEGVYPKFCILGRNIFIATGRTTLCQRLFRGAQRMIADCPETSFAHWAGFLQFALRKQWESRPPAQISEQLDSLAGGLLGFDGEKLRCLWWFSRKNFEPYETTKDPNSRIACDGFFEESDNEYLQMFTQRVGIRGERESPEWIAGELRSCIGELSRRHEDLIDPAVHFALLDRNGAREVSPEFPLPVSDDQQRAVPATVNATINIASFAMRVPGMTDIQENSGAITGLAYNTLYYVYEDDPGFAGGAVTYHATTTKATAIDNAGRFFVGSCVTPRAGAPDTTGNGDGGGAANFGMTTVLSMSVQSTNLQSGNGALANPQNALDNDLTTFAKLTASGNGALNDQNFILSGPPGMNTKFSSSTLFVQFAVPTNSLPNLVSSAAAITYSLDGGFSIAGALLSVAGGTTAAYQSASVALPFGQNISQVRVIASVTTSEGAGNAPSGSVELDIYDAHINGIQ